MVKNLLYGTQSYFFSHHSYIIRGYSRSVTRIFCGAFGDPTARLAGRLTLNPTKHLDPVGSFLVPVATYLLGGFIIGWAKPVPYNPYNLHPQKLGTAVVAGAGIFANFIIAFVFGLLIRFAEPLGIASEAFFTIAGMIVFINLLLGIFNLVPIPPLDGSKLLFPSCRTNGET